MVQRTDPYIPGEQVNDPAVLKLNTNENPYPPSPKVITAIQQEAEGKLQLYPSPTADDLRETIGAYYQLDKEEVFVGNGSDEVLAFSFMAFFEPGEKIRYPEITYSFYPVYAKLFDIPFEEIPLEEDFSLSIEKYFGAEGGVILPNPNAPTSLYKEIGQIEEIVKNNPDKVVIIDEAYIDFASTSAAVLIPKYENLLVIQTTSKSRSLAGLRVGYALGNRSLIDALIRIKDSMNSYTIDRLALVGAKAAFEDIAYFEETTAKIKSTREKVKGEMAQLGFEVLPSEANFIFVTHPDLRAGFLYEALKKEKVLVRYFNTDLIDNHLRITIGTEEEMDRFLDTVKEVIRTAQS